jgi:hypothetical protein
MLLRSLARRKQGFKSPHLTPLEAAKPAAIANGTLEHH